MRQMIQDVVDGAKARGGSPKLRHTDLLVFGLALRDISAMLRMQKNEPVEPPFSIPSSLTKEDYKFIVQSLEDLLRWAGHPCYLPGVQEGRRPPRAEGQLGEGSEEGAVQGRGKATKQGAFTKRARGQK